MLLSAPFWMRSVRPMWAASLQNVSTSSSRSFIGPSESVGMEMSTGIRRRNVSSRSVSCFVVAPMSIKREVRGVLSPTRRNTPVSE